MGGSQRMGLLPAITLAQHIPQFLNRSLLCKSEGFDINPLRKITLEWLWALRRLRRDIY